MTIIEKIDLHAIARKYFNQEYHNLTEAEKEMVMVIQSEQRIQQEFVEIEENE